VETSSAVAAASLQFSARLTSTTPGAQSGLVVHEVFPDGAEGRPKLVKHGVYELAAVFNQAAMPACQASDGEIEAGGLQACPAETALGTGSASVITGFGPPTDPLAADIHVYHGPESEIYVFTPAGQERPILNVARAHVSGSTITEDPVYPSGWPPPEGKAAPSEITVDYAPANPAYITTPASCPKSRYWTSTARLTYTDGSSDTVASRTPCRHHRRRGVSSSV
jgi:hypothetical protein